MSGRATLVMIGLLVALCALYWGTGRIEEVQRREVEEARRLFTFAGSDVTTLIVQRRGEEPVSALRSAGASWSIDQPHDIIPASGPVWEYIAETIAQLSNRRTIESEAFDVSTYGLDDPHLLMMVGTGTGELSQIAFGALEPTQVNRYAQVTGGEVVLVPEQSVQEMNRSLSDLRDRRLITLNPEGFERVELFQRGMVSEETVGEEPPKDLHSVFGYDASGTWIMTEPSAGPADQKLVNTLIAGLFTSFGRDYLDMPESLIDYGLAEPAYEVTVHSTQEEPQTLSIGWVAEVGETGGYYAKREDSPSVFIVDHPLVDLLAGSPNLFREGRLFTRSATELTTIHYEDSKHTIRLENDPAAGWTMTDPQVNDTDQGFVSMYIAGLKLLRAVSFPEKEVATGLDPPRIRLGFEFGGGGEFTTIEVGDVVPGSQASRFYARQDNGGVVVVPLEAELLIRSRPFDFRRRNLLDFAPERARQLVLTIDGEEYIFDKREDVWRVTQPADRQLESQDDVAGMLESLRLVEVLNIADPPPSEAIHSLDTPVLTARVVLEIPAETRVRTQIGPLRVGNLKAPQSRERFVTIGSRSEIYTMDQGVLDDIRSALRGVVSR